MKPVVFIGLISYSLYLWHWPLIALWSYWLERPLDTLEAALAVALSFAIAVASWRYVERPFRHHHDAASAHRISPADRRFVAAAAASVVVVIAIAMSLKVFKGFPERYDANVQTVLEQLVAGNPLRGSCDDYQNVFSNDDVCNLGRKRAEGESYDVTLLGDSMADHWAPLVAMFADEKQLAFRQVTNGGCGRFAGIELSPWPVSKAPECAAYQQEAAAFVDANPKLKMVVISGWWEKWLARIEHPGVNVEVPAATSEDEARGLTAPRFDKVLKDTIETFTKRGIKVLLIGQIPTYGTLPVRCIKASVRDKVDAGRCGMTRAAAEKQLTRSNAALKRAAATLPGVAVSLPLDYMCQELRCSPIADGTLLYKNGGHVNRFGAEYLRRFVEFPRLP